MQQFRCSECGHKKKYDWIPMLTIDCDKCGGIMYDIERESVKVK